MRTTMYWDSQQYKQYHFSFPECKDFTDKELEIPTWIDNFGRIDIAEI